MIDREDMLALTRRMTVKRTSMTRIAGGYMDSDGCIDGTFNIAFLKLSPADREKNLQIAKKVPFAETNQNLQEYKFLQENMQNNSLWKLLMGMRACGLKNDAVTEEEKNYALELLSSFGKVEIVPEHLIDASVSVSGALLVARRYPLL